MTAELHEEGQRVNRKKMARVMRRYRIQGCGYDGRCSNPSRPGWPPPCAPEH
ncbi:hypothetical protein [Actinoplanes sp. NPDC051411]|uniref:hypothetical protein n=1 Tax=Actinoplanes sp. NPDC051411 TaxID=3155522 RepID=UPI00342E1F1D